MIFLDTNVVSEAMRKTPDEAVVAWLIRHDDEIALSSVVVGEIAFGIAKIRPDERAQRLEQSLADWRKRFAGRIYSLTEEAALAYGEIMGRAARTGHVMTALDGMIAAIARVHGSRLATRNLRDFAATGLDLVSPWDF